MHHEFERPAVASCKAVREAFGDHLVALAVFESVEALRFDSDVDLSGMLGATHLQRRARWWLAEGMGERLRPLQTDLAGHVSARSCC